MNSILVGIFFSKNGEFANFYKLSARKQVSVI